MSSPDRLARSITLPFLIMYGLGTMVGGGFYALLGKGREKRASMHRSR